MGIYIFWASNVSQSSEGFHSRDSHALENRRSRSIVDSDTPIASAVSSFVSHPK